MTHSSDQIFSVQIRVNNPSETPILRHYDLRWDEIPSFSMLGIVFIYAYIVRPEHPVIGKAGTARYGRLRSQHADRDAMA